MGVRNLYRCVLCGQPKELRAYVCAECRRQIQMRRRRRIGLASPFSKSRRQTLPPTTSNKH
jgi:DNA-directed RNA polymerase subunit RPC12/RpoP